MWRLALKQYQTESLSILRNYAAAVREKSLLGVHRPEHDAFAEFTERDYLSTPGFGGVPYVCLRIPTGGGKTLLGAHAVGVVGRSLLATDRPAVLWITPSTTIRDQTLRGLKNPNHPYRAAIEEELGAAIEVMTLEEALTRPQFVRPGGPAIVIVTTIQSYRIRDDRSGEELDATRRIYRDNGYMKEPLENLPAAVVQDLQRDESGLIQLSLANALRVRQPIVVMDEAHNARTPVSFESLMRFGPSFVLELTATPEQTHDPSHRTNPKYASNVLHSVSALALKNEGMIKLPVELENRSDWLEVLAATKHRREELEFLADLEHRDNGVQPIRPIALIQAQPNSKTKEMHTVEAVKKALIEKLEVPESDVKICTGSVDEIGDTDLMALQCPIRYIITVDKLREGWDCPFAYVLGSIGNTATATAVEQLIGRILRMPNACPTNVPALDRAYAFVLSDNVVQTAMQLRDRMVETCGFDERSAADALRVKVNAAQQGLGFSRIPMTAPPATDKLTPTLANKIRWEPESSTLVLEDLPTPTELHQLQNAVNTEQDKKAIDDYWELEKPAGITPKLPGQFAVPFVVPRLSVKTDDRRRLLEPIELDQFDWDLNKCDVSIPESEFASDIKIGNSATIDIESRGGNEAGLVSRVGSEVRLRQLELIREDDDWSEVNLVRWIDREIHRGDSLQGLPLRFSQPWLLRVIQALVQKRGIPLSMLVRRRHELAEVIRVKITDHGRLQLRKATEMLIKDDPESITTDRDFAVHVEEFRYNPTREYSGGHKFKKHAFDLIGDMNKKELETATIIDSHPNVKRWLRNLDHESHGGFWLPKSPGKFFPDFIVELLDGTIVIVEYKNAKLASNPDEQHKRDIGELWAQRSPDGYRFAWVVEGDWEKLKITLAN